MRRQLFHLISTVIFAGLVFSGCSMQQTTRPESSTINLDTVRAGQFDTGKMWTFDFPPTDYFARTYGFNPDKEWFEKARLSAVRIPGCTASFVSEDGLIMTNHHCARGALDAVNKEGEKLAELGFYAPTLADERKSPVTYVDQLVVIDDVTAEVQKAFDSGTTDDEKVSKRNAKMFEIQQRSPAKYKESPRDSMVFSVIAFYNGGKYSLYGYRRYTDVRLVYAPEEAAAFFGGDPDNFTYPRYDFDCSFFRVYDADGKPMKTKNFFRFSKDGAADGEAIFVIGNPGRTSRLLTVAQLEFNRDLRYPYTVSLLDHAHAAYAAYVEHHPETKLKYQTMIFGLANSLKAYDGELSGLRDDYLMARKKDFERNFRNAVAAKPELKAKYGDPWSAIEEDEKDRAKLFGEVNAYFFHGFGRSAAIALASDLVDFANQMKMPAEQRGRSYRGAMLDTTKARMYPASAVPEIEQTLLVDQLASMKSAFGGRNDEFDKLLNGRTPAQAAADLMKSSVIADREKVKTLLNGNPDEILNSTDPLIAFIVKTQDRAKLARDTFNDLGSKETAKVQVLGQALYDVYGTTIPPDATFTLRIADGVVKGYEYNGTIAPTKTTFYGLYDRYYSFGKMDPFDLTERWKNPPATMNLSTPFNFIATNDIIGGNSGSAMVNKNLEVVGLIFDGNIESLPGDFIYTDAKNRAVGVHSSGILEGLDKIYRADRLVKELKASKIE